MIAATEDWEKAKEFKVLKRNHVGLAELRFSVKTKKRGKEKIRRFRPLGIWHKETKEFIFLVGCEKAQGLYDPQNVFELALSYKAKIEGGRGEICEHY